jgi:hypothetical protein
MKSTARYLSGRCAQEIRVVLSLYRRHLKTRPNAGDRFVRKGDKCPVWVESIDPQGVYHRKSLRTGSWDIGERLMRDMMVPAAAVPPANVARPETEPPISLESAISTFIANLEMRIARRTRFENIGSCSASFRDSRTGIDSRSSPS